ncbi:hypothetical protein [Streptococcus suis]|uniref:hypothetical protein n=1 Tax=Streptococcus suis TaxID=1307 RepID=UPI001D03A564|nr:hypothetical protein [Streptococcus suis]
MVWRKTSLLDDFSRKSGLSVGTILAGLLLGLALDKLFYALLLKAMQMPVVLASTFQLKSLVTVFIYLFGILPWSAF